MDMDREILSYKTRLDDGEACLLSNPPCKLYSPITKFISPNPNNINRLGTPKPQNPYILYRKNFTAKHKSLGSRKDWRILSKEASDSWKNESDKVKSYFKALAKLALQKHKSIYDKKGNRNQPPKKFIFVTQPEPNEGNFYETNDNYCAISSLPPSSSFSFPWINDNPSSSYQQPEPQQKQKDNNNNADYVVSLLHSSSSSSTFLHSNYNTGPSYQQPELLQSQKDNNNNNDCMASTPLYSSCTNDKPNSLPSTYFNPSTSFLPCSTSSDYNTFSINYNNNIINKSNLLLQSAQFDITTNLNNDENFLEEFQQFLQKEQTDAQLNETYRNLLDFCYKKNENMKPSKQQ